MSIPDYTEALRADLERMGFDYDALAATSQFFSNKACFQYHVEFKKDNPLGQLTEDIGFTFQMVFPDDDHFYIDRVIVDCIGQFTGYSPFSRVYVRTQIPFPTKKEMITQFLQRKSFLQQSRKNQQQPGKS